MGIVVNLESGKNQSPSLDLMVNLTNKDLLKVNELIVRCMNSPVNLIPQIAGHIVAAGGKLRGFLESTAAPSAQVGGSRRGCLGRRPAQV